MGNLTPGAKYIYESPDGGGSVYARDSNTNERRLVGYSFDALEKKRKEEQIALWQDILKESENHEALKKALDHAILLYKLVKEDKKEMLWHPV